MPVTIDGTTGVTTPGATVGAITGILKATSGVVSQAVAGTDYLTSTSGGAITLATAQTASGTSVDFTGIPSWVKRITVMFSGISTSGTSNIQLQLGDAGGFETSGYNGAMSRMGAAAMATSQYPTTGFLLVNDLLAADVLSGVFILPLIGSNIWCGTHQLSEHASPASFFGSGTKTLSNTLTQVRITTVNGTDTFDAGTINISYE